NNMGKLVNVKYAPSTEDYLADREAGTPWVTKLPFPVHVLRETETIDRIGGVRHHTEYRYHHGYFDGPEREFRGFGMVETIDTKAYEAYEDTDQGRHYVQPVITRTWFHTGAYLKMPGISTHFAGEYFKGTGDISGDELVDTVIENQGVLGDQELREAHRALKGVTLRQEVYEYDHATKKPKITFSDGGVERAEPYTAAESNFNVRTVQRLNGQKHGVFAVEPRETITWHYEQNSSDPRVAHQFTLDVDSFGNVKKTASVVYPRHGGSLPDEQTTPHITCQLNRFINNDPLGLGEAGDSTATGTFHLLGIPNDSRSFEIGGITVSTPGYLGFDEMAAHLSETDSVNGALHPSKIIRFDQSLTTGPQARLISWQRFAYWNQAQSSGVFGEVTDKGLVHHVETAMFTPELLDAVYGTNGITGGMLTEGGYKSYPSGDEAAYLWNAGIVQFYEGAAGFYLPNETQDPWGNSVTVTFDSYRIAPISTLDAVG
ncbi:MAG: hypothetical protein GY700_10935, partial [Propionibacteriaceae bacterium]|nr:hypothetical protein [Propionibacteriaceae bacterium]